MSENPYDPPRSDTSAPVRVERISGVSGLILLSTAGKTLVSAGCLAIGIASVRDYSPPADASSNQGSSVLLWVSIFFSCVALAVIALATFQLAKDERLPRWYAFGVTSVAIIAAICLALSAAVLRGFFT